MKMPESVLQAKHKELDDQVPSPTDETISDKESLGNISLDSCDWQDCSGEVAEQEYVVLYDDSSSDGD
jgi:hypothetical protein